MKNNSYRDYLTEYVDSFREQYDEGKMTMEKYNRLIRKANEWLYKYEAVRQLKTN